MSCIQIVVLQQPAQQQRNSVRTATNTDRLGDGGMSALPDRLPPDRTFPQIQVQAQQQYQQTHGQGSHQVCTGRLESQHRRRNSGQPCVATHSHRTFAPVEITTFVHLYIAGTDAHSSHTDQNIAFALERSGKQQHDGLFVVKQRLKTTVHAVQNMQNMYGSTRVGMGRSKTKR